MDPLLRHAPSLNAKEPIASASGSGCLGRQHLGHIVSGGITPKFSFRGAARFRIQLITALPKVE
jgi:hypothetical protein